jgi:uncharacterized membrane protein
MTLLGQVHLATAIVSLGSGAAVLLMSPKGTRRHRQVGWVYAVSMLLLNATALMIYKLFGGFGPFHVAAVISLAGLAAGVWCALQAKSSRVGRDLAARGRWVARHYYWMTWSYVGLCAAAVSETATRLPIARPGPGAGLEFGIAVAVATLLVVAIGASLIRSRVQAQLAAVAVKSS